MTDPFDWITNYWNIKGFAQKSSNQDACWVFHIYLDIFNIQFCRIINKLRENLVEIMILHQNVHF